MYWLKLMISVDIIVMTFKQQINSVTSTSARKWSKVKLAIFTMGSRRFGVELQSVTCLQPWSHTTAMELEVSQFEEGSPWLGGHNSTSARSPGSSTVSLSLLCLTPVAMGTHSSFKTTMQEPIVHVLSKITKIQDHLQFRRFTTPPWAAKSPDQSPIEHLWDILGRRVRRRSHKSEDINELADALQEECRRILLATIGRLTRSMRRRCFASLAANGSPTRYWDFCQMDITDAIQVTWLISNFVADGKSVALVSFIRSDMKVWLLFKNKRFWYHFQIKYTLRMQFVLTYPGKYNW